MADTVTSQTLVDSTRNAVMAFQNQSDATGEAAVLKVDVSALSGAPAGVRILGIHYATQGMAVKVLWDATTDVLAFTVPPDASGYHDFRPFGGLQNNAGSGKTGDINFTTIGAGAGDSYSIILEMAKD